MSIWTLLATLLAPAASAAPVQADLHLDTPTQLHAQGLTLDAPARLESGLREMRAGGTNLAVMALWPPRQADHRAHTEALLTTLEAEVTRLSSVVLVRTPTEARAAAAAGQLGVTIALEGAHGLGAGAWRPVLDDLTARGLSMLGLTWSLSNRFAGSCADGGGGLTAEGRALVQEARSRGLLLDVSHASRATTLEVCRDTRIPVVASHSGAHAVRGVPRNLTDEEIRCIAETGGVIGVNFHAPFVSADADVSAVADHLDHMARIGGRGVTALGSDFDGYIQTPRGLEDASKLDALWTELARRGWSEADIAGTRGENFLRAWAGAQAAARP